MTATPPQPTRRAILRRFLLTEDAEGVRASCVACLTRLGPVTDSYALVAHESVCGGGVVS